MRRWMAIGLVLFACGGGRRPVPAWADRILDGPPRVHTERDVGPDGVRLTLFLADTCVIDTEPTGGAAHDGTFDTPIEDEYHPCNLRPLPQRLLFAHPHLMDTSDRSLGFELTTDRDGAVFVPWNEIPTVLYVYLEEKPVAMLNPNDAPRSVDRP